MAVAAGALALTLGTTVAASASGGTGTLSAGSGAILNTAPQHGKTAFSTADTGTAAASSTWMFGIDGRDSAGRMWDYPPKTDGGWGTKVQTGHDLQRATAFFKINSANTAKVNLYARFGTQLRIYGSTSSSGTVISNGWQIYNAFVTPGNVGGAAYPDLLARDTSGVLWEYLSYSNGKLDNRVRVGAGWNIYKEIAGYGDLTGDGKPDILARDSAGSLWMYKGTGNYKAPFLSRVKIGAGWNGFNRMLGLGDNNADGKYDLVARRNDGVLFFYPGTGKASSPFGARQQIGAGWSVFNYLF